MAKNQKKAAKSGNPAVRAEASRQVSSVADFKKKKGGTQVVTLPSGATVKMRNPGGLQLFMSEGIIPNPLMKVMQDAMKTGQKPAMEDIMMDESGNMDMSMVQEVLRMNDTVAMRCLVEPRVHAVPEDEADRDDDLLYIDEVDDEDKMFIFNWVVGGTSDVAQFRREFASTMDDMGAVEAVGGSTE